MWWLEAGKTDLGLCPMAVFLALVWCWTFGVYDPAVVMNAGPSSTFPQTMRGGREHKMDLGTVWLAWYWEEKRRSPWPSLQWLLWEQKSWTSLSPLSTPGSWFLFVSPFPLFFLPSFFIQVLFYMTPYMGDQRIARFLLTKNGKKKQGRKSICCIQTCVYL